ncbi:hypothetical protein V8C42DRAFT_350937 [Trichoderma barbatum]
MQFSITRDLLLVIMASTAFPAITSCNEGEVAVGTQQLCGLGDPRGGPNCCDIRLRRPCAGGPGNRCVKWIHPGTVGCTADGTPSLIQTEGGFFGRRRKVISICSPSSFIFQFASWCCPSL